MMYRTKTTKCFVLPSIHFFIRVMGNETLKESNIMKLYPI